MKIKSVEDLTLDQKVGQLILPGFHSLTIDSHLNELIEDYSMGNVILFTRNFSDAKQMFALTKDIHKRIIEKTGIIPFIAIDQEGGLVTRMMKDVTFAPGPMTCTASGENASYETGKMLAEDMIKLGMNLNLAPSLDVNNNPNNPVINVRSFSDSPEIVADMGHKFIKGSSEFGVLACAKHFPGHGDCAVDSHLGLPCINYDLDRIYKVEMYPFIKNIDVPAIMSAHIMFPKLDTVPATLSKNIITNLLRKELNYQGLIISDCLEMKAIADNYGTAKGALMAIEAGVDLVCISHTKEVQEEAHRLIKDAVLNNELPEEELNKKVARILKYKEKTLSYLEKYFYNSTCPTFSEENKVKALNIVENSLTIVKGTQATLSNKTLVIAPIATARTIIEDEFDERNLAKALRKEFNDITVYELKETIDFKNDIMNKLNEFDNIIFFTYNAVTSKFQVNFVNDILSKKDAHIISLKGPMDYHLYNNLNNYMCMYEYTPNSIKTIIKFFKNELCPMGKLPIKL